MSIVLLYIIHNLNLAWFSGVPVNSGQLYWLPSVPIEFCRDCKELSIIIQISTVLNYAPYGPFIFLRKPR